jgi:hypothetical protein
VVCVSEPAVYGLAVLSCRLHVESSESFSMHISSSCNVVSSDSLFYPGQSPHAEAMLLSPFHTRAMSRGDSQGELVDDPITTHRSPPSSADNSRPLSPSFGFHPFSEDGNPFQPSPIDCKYFYSIARFRRLLALPLFNSITPWLRCCTHVQ